MGSRPAYLPIFGRIRDRSRRRSVRHRPPSRRRSAPAWRRPAIWSTSTAWAPPNSAVQPLRACTCSRGRRGRLGPPAARGPRWRASRRPAAADSRGGSWTATITRSSPATSNASSPTTPAGRRGHAPLVTLPVVQDEGIKRDREHQEIPEGDDEEPGGDEGDGGRTIGAQRTLAHDSYGVMSRHIVHKGLARGSAPVDPWTYGVTPRPVRPRRRYGPSRGLAGPDASCGCYHSARGGCRRMAAPRWSPRRRSNHRRPK